MMKNMASYTNQLAAFARKIGDSIRVEEYLVDHLGEVAYYAYTTTGRYTRPLAELALLAGLLHDVGKAICIYQQCLPGSSDGCSYVGHEVFSAVVAAKLLERANWLEMDERRMIVYAVLAHHQYMGPPWERLSALRYKLKSQRLSPENTIRLEVGLGELLRAALTRLREKLQGYHALRVVGQLEATAYGVRGIELDYGLQRLVASPSHSWELARQLGDLAPKDMDKPSSWIKARILAGIVMVVDKYVAAKARSGSAPNNVKAFVEYRA